MTCPFLEYCMPYPFLKDVVVDTVPSMGYVHTHMSLIAVVVGKCMLRAVRMAKSLVVYDMMVLVSAQRKQWDVAAGCCSHSCCRGMGSKHTAIVAHPVQKLRSHTDLVAGAVAKLVTYSLCCRSQMCFGQDFAKHSAVLDAVAGEQEVIV